jgi:hypothetical protein
MRRQRLLIVGLVVTSLFVPSWAWALHQQNQPDLIPVGVGEIVKVSGVPIGCTVRRQDGQRALDCRRIGPLAGTYGTILTRTRLVVVRFDNARTGTIVFSAQHGRLRARTCEGSRS